MGRRVRAFGASALQCGKGKIGLSEVTMTDLIVFLCVGGCSDCRVVVIQLRVKSIFIHRFLCVRTR